MPRAKTTKKAASGISKQVEDRIVELSLQNPEFGARRLLSLLKKEKTGISSSQVYGVLKRNGLQNRELRLAKLDEPHSKKDLSAPEKTPVELTPETEERIVEISLENPDFGARRLAGVLAGEGIIISSSAVYTLLKRHGLQNRSLRLQRIELERLTDTPEPVVETAALYEIPMPAPAKVPQRIPQDTGRAWETPPAVSAAQAPVTSTHRARWLFFLGNILLLALIGYLGYQAVLKFQQARMAPVTFTTVEAAPVRVAVQQEPEVQPLKAYSKIWERNLFNTAEENSAAPKTEIPVDNIAPAKKDIGLKLMGTAVADDPAMSMAIIHNHSDSEQKIYYEGDKAGEVWIKKILRDKVIITTDQGDALLDANAEDSGKGSKTASPAQQTTAERGPSAGGESLGSPPEVSAASFADIDALMAQVHISPFLHNDQAVGIRLTGITSRSPLKKLRLRNGDVITGVNGERITDPAEANRFFEKLAEGGDITLQVIRRRRPKLIHLNIN
jgi:type II secretion system protein C